MSSLNSSTSFPSGVPVARPFRDKSELVRKALEFFQREIEQKELEESASLYAQLPEADDEAKQWVADSAEDWPI